MNSIDIKKDFPLLQQTMQGYPIRFCDNASTTQKPQAMLDALFHFYTHENANTFRGIYELGEVATERYEQARATVARFLNASSPTEIIFTSGSTAGINAVAHSWVKAQCKPRDEIVITQLEHHANWLPWQHLAESNGVIIRVIPVQADGTLDMAAAAKLITTRTKFVAVTWISNAIGTHVPVAELVTLAHAVGARILIDAAQVVAHQRIDLQVLKPDFLVFSGHKLCAPTGIGVLYIAKELHETMEPFQRGGGMVLSVGTLTGSPSTWLPAPYKYEAGTPPIAQAIGLAAAIDYCVQYIDYDQLRLHEAALCARLIDGLQQHKKVRILGPVAQLRAQGHLVSFVIDGTHAHDVAAYCAQRGICVRAGHHCAQPLAEALGYAASVRVSFFAYNSTDDVDAILAAIGDLV